MQKLTFAKAVGPQDWEALPRQFEVGESIVRYSGHDYGCARDDFMILGRPTIACSLDGDTPFFTVPVEFLRDANGEQPPAPYVRVG